jgi:glycyl-tRNA synthetase beta chain
MSSDTLLVEILTEELPPKSLQHLGVRFAEGIGRRLQELAFAEAGASVTPYASPRRLGVVIEGVLGQQPERETERKGPAVASGIGADGKATKALEGFARSCGVAVGALEKMHDGKAEYFVFRSRKAGESIDAHLAGVVQAAIKELPIPKLMRWGEHEFLFVRPVHGLIQLHGARVVPGEVLGLRAGNMTRGHRFLAEGALRIEHARDYAQVLKQKGAVIASFNTRRDDVASMLDVAAAKLNAVWIGHSNYSSDELLGLLPAERAELSSLLPEVAALVEWPVVYQGSFDEAFLAVPQECLILSMQQHQKYFPLLDRESGRLLNRFLIVSNVGTDDPSSIVAGNERVLRARLADAKFFFDQDRKVRLSERVERLGAVVYHNKLGTQLERVQRLRKLASAIAGRLHADSDKAERAA